jgi:uncharacterized membrane protein YjfL (UPF0719 family)
MEFLIIITNSFYAICGMALLFGFIWFVDYLTPSVNFIEELKKGNAAIAIFLAGVFISFSIMLGLALH